MTVTGHSRKFTPRAAAAVAVAAAELAAAELAVVELAAERVVVPAARVAVPAAREPERQEAVLVVMPTR
jgi:hypothetical protein